MEHLIYDLNKELSEIYERKNKMINNIDMSDYHNEYEIMIQREAKIIKKIDELKLKG